MKPYQLEAQQRQPVFKADNTLTISFNTPELSIADKTSLLENANLMGILSFIPDGGEQFELLKIDAKVEGKTPTERLYSVLFVYWKQQTEKKLEARPFDEFRKAKMENFIEHIKKQLD